MTSEDEQQISSNSDASSIARGDVKGHEEGERLALPSHVAVAGTLGRPAGTVRDYAQGSTADSTNTAYASDWKHIGRIKGTDPLPPHPRWSVFIWQIWPRPLTRHKHSQSQPRTAPFWPCIAWYYQQSGFTFDRQDRYIATVLAGIKRKHARPPEQKEAILRSDILAMVATLPYNLRGLRNRAMLLLRDRKP